MQGQRLELKHGGTFICDEIVKIGKETYYRSNYTLWHSSKVIIPKEAEKPTKIEAIKPVSKVEHKNIVNNNK